MKIDDLISELEDVKEEHGNLKIRVGYDYIEEEIAGKVNGEHLDLAWPICLGMENPEFSTKN